MKWEQNTVEPQFSDFIHSGKLLEEQFVWEPNLLGLFPKRQWLITQVLAQKGCCVENETCCFVRQLTHSLRAQCVWEPDSSRTEMFEKWGLTVFLCPEIFDNILSDFYQLNNPFLFSYSKTWRYIIMSQ